MTLRLSRFWDTLRSGYWFIPAVMALVAIGLSFLGQELDERYKFDVQMELPWFFTGGTEGARAVLSVIAGSMITVAGVVFSVTIVALANTSQQFGPRLLRNFLRDTGNQIVLGTFIATFIYCVLTLRTVSGTENTLFVPHISITIGLLLSLTSLGVLIYFIHHTANMIHVSNVIARVGRELQESIPRLFPEAIGVATDDQPDAIAIDNSQITVMPDSNQQSIEATEIGYVQAIDTVALMNIARTRDIAVRIIRGPGAFVVPGSAIVSVWPSERAVPELTVELNEAFILGDRRTPHQEIELFFDELAEIALRALSAAINDPFTAITAIDWISGGLCLLARRRMPPRYRYDQDGSLRVIAPVTSFATIVDSVFGQIRNAGGHHPQLTLKLVDAISTIAPCTSTDEQRDALLHQITIIERESRGDRFTADEQEHIRESYRRAVDSLSERSTVNADSR